MRELPKNKGKLGRAQSIRLSSEASARIDNAVKRLNLARQDVIRLVVDIGLEHLEAVKYDLAKAVLNDSIRQKK